jgi:hypothetical protein
MAGILFVHTIKTAIMKNKNLIAAFLIVFNLHSFAQDADMSLIPYRLGNLWGYADPDKKIVITPAYEAAELFSEGYAAVKKGGKYGYINKAGKQVIPFKFFVAKPFRVGYFARGAKIVTADDIDDNQKAILFAPASLRADGYEICIDTRGEAMKGCPAITENSAPDINKLTTITTEKNYSTVKQNDIFDKIVDDYKLPISEDNYYIATKGTSYGVFNNKFEIIVPFEYTMIKKWEINNSICLEVQGNAGKGLLLGNGVASIASDNSVFSVVKAMDGKYYIIAGKNGKTGIKDATNNDLLAANYTDISYDAAGGFILTGDNGYKGFRFLNNYTLGATYNIVRPVKGGEYVIVTSPSGRMGYINSKGDEFFVE